MAKRPPLNWEIQDTGLYRAHDKRGVYVISRDDSGKFVVGYFPAVGQEREWEQPLATLEEAKESAERCADSLYEMARQRYC